ncbi:MAG: DUF4395 domain-containing protein [Roseiflexaceae bacterium]|nr:DUF4395 domain-containing protein [Roseiflexaceae bacterium]
MGSMNQVIGERVDRTALRVNQALIIVFLTAAFLLDSPWLVVFVAVVMVLGTITPALALFQRLYRDVLKPASVLKPDVHAEAAAPHRFAQGMGGTVLVGASVALLAGALAVGWALAILVIVLAAVNLFFGFCAGCFVFFQLQRLRRS